MVAGATEAMVGAATPPLADSPLGRTIATTATDIWNDSCAVGELEYAISYGAVGATANPTIVADVWKADPAHWRGRVRALADLRPSATEVDLAWAIVEEMSLRAAPLLLPAFEASGGRQGRLSMQTDPTFFRAYDRMLEQGTGFDRLAAGPARMVQRQLERELRRGRYPQVASGEGRHDVEVFFNRLKNAVRVQIDVPHHFGEHVPLDLGEGEKNVFVRQQRVLATAGFFDRAVDDALCSFANLAR